MFHRFRVLSTVTLKVHRALVGEGILADIPSFQGPLHSHIEGPQRNVYWPACFQSVWSILPILFSGITFASESCDWLYYTPWTDQEGKHQLLTLSHVHPQRIECDSRAGLCRIFLVWNLLAQEWGADPQRNPDDLEWVSNSLYVWLSRAMGRKLLELAGSFPGFSVATVLACLHNFKMWILKQLFNMSSIHQSGPKCLSCSQRMLSSPTAFCFITLMSSWSSLVVKGLVK